MRVVAVNLEGATSVFELDSNTLPPLALRINAALRFAIGEAALYRFDQEAKLVTNHPKEKNDPLLVHRCMPETTEPDWRTVHRSVHRGPYSPGASSLLARFCHFWRDGYFVPRPDLQLPDHRGVRFFLLQPFPIGE